MNSPFSEFNDLAHWRSTAALPPGTEPHPKFPKSVAERIARESKILDPRKVHMLWVQLSRSAHDYDQLSGINFNEERKKLRAHRDDALKKLRALESTLEEMPEKSALFFEGVSIGLLYGQEGTSETPQNNAQNQPSSFVGVKRNVASAIAFFEISELYMEELSRGRTSNHPLNTYARQLLNFWHSTLGREVSIDPNVSAPYTPAMIFLSSCCEALANIPNKQVFSAARNWRTDKK